MVEVTFRSHYENKMGCKSCFMLLACIIKWSNVRKHRSLGFSLTDVITSFTECICVDLKHWTDYLLNKSPFSGKIRCKSETGGLLFIDMHTNSVWMPCVVQVSLLLRFLKVIGRFKHSSGWKKQIKHHSYVTDLFIYFSLFSIIMELFAAQQQMALKV